MPQNDVTLEALLDRVARAPSPFYRTRLAGLGASAAAGFAELPPTSRDELLRDQLAHLPHGTRRFADAAAPVRAGTTGTGAALLVLTWTAADLARERAAGARLLGRIGIRAGMRVANTLPGALATPGSLLLGDVIEEIGALDVPLGEIISDTAARAAWELVDRVQPDVLVLPPETAPRFLGTAPAGERPWWQGIIWLRSGAGAIPPLPASFSFAGWQRTWLAVPEATNFVAATCAGGHFHADEALLAEAEGAHLVLTPLGVDTPVVRYDSALPCRMRAGVCPCGAPGIVFDLT